MVVYTKEQVLELTQTDFARLNSEPERPLCFPGFTGEFDQAYREALAYVRSLITSKLKDQIGSPIFNFVVEEDFGSLSEGAKKWVGIIPRELPPSTLQDLARSAADVLTLHEQERLQLENSELNGLQTTIHNALIAVLHYSLKAAPDVDALNLALYGEKNFISYNKLEEKIRDLHVEGKELTREQADVQLINLLKELGAVPHDASSEKTREVLRVIIKAKADAWKLYKELGTNIEEAQKFAGVEGELAGVDLNDEHPSLHFLEHLKAIYGLSETHGKTPEDRYELQVAANLTWLIARLSTHPVYRTLIEHKDEVEERFLKTIYQSSGIFQKNNAEKKFFLDENMRITSEGAHKYTWQPTVFDSQLNGFDDLTQDKKQVYRAGFRAKEGLSLLVKAIRDRQELSHISDALAGEAVMTGIKERDLDPIKNPGTAERLQAFMEAQAREIGNGFGLVEAPATATVSQLPKGTFKVVTKLTPEKKGEHSFNFPAVKIYFNAPVNPEKPDGKSIRMEYRLVCSDTWLRANKQTNSMSYHDKYKMKQGVDLLDIQTARAYDNTTHTVASKFRAEVKRREAVELLELEALEAA